MNKLSWRLWIEEGYYDVAVYMVDLAVALQAC
jgi:hypothetical protein